MDATTIALTIGGLAQPYVQEFIIRNRVDGQVSLLVTIILSLLIASFSTWIVGGFSDINIPQFTLQDPSPLVEYIWFRFAAVFSLSQIIFNVTRKTPIDVHVVAGTTATPSK